MNVRHKVFAGRAMAFICVATMLAGELRGSSETLNFSGWDARREGEFVTIVQGERTLRLEACFVAKGWRFETVGNAIQDAKKDGDKLVVSFRAVSPAGAKWQDNLPMLIVLRGDASTYPDDRLRVGGAVASFDKANVWGWGNTLESDTFGLAFSAGSKMSISFWNKPDTKSWNARFHTKGVVQADGSTLFEETLIVAKKGVAVPRPPESKPTVDIVAQKRVQYGRILYPPQEKGFNPDEWINRIESPEVKREDFEKIENLLDVRSRLYFAAERARTGGSPKPAVEDMVAAGYAALNGMDVTGATAACEKLEALPGVGSAVPSRANPFTWVKSFTQWGYMRHPEGTSIYEPDPWNLQWEDGFRFNVAQDPRVKIANPPEGSTRFFETRFAAPMTDVKTERTWTGTRWLMSDGRSVEFSLLAPFVDISGTDTLTLGGFTKSPDRLVWFSPEGRWRGLELTGRAAPKREVLETVLEEAPQDSPKKSPAPSKGEQMIVSSDVGRPWLLLECGGAVGLSGDLVAIFPGARPVSAKFEKGVFTLKLEKKSYVSVLRLRDNLHPQEQAEVCEFFARVAVAPPVSCEEKVEDGRVVWKYSHRVRENAWIANPSTIAPVPPLADYAELSMPGSKKFKYPTKWGIYRYRDGDVSEAALPAEFLSRHAPRRGVNYRLAESRESLDAHIAAGARSFRLCIGKRSPIDESCAKLETLLSDYEGRGVTFLVDPHNVEYRATWDDGFGDAEAQSKFLALWERISQIGGRHAGVIEGYDLYNEPGLIAGAEGGWKELNERAARVIRKNHPGAPVYYSSVYAGNPNGLFNLRPLEVPSPQTITCHFYTPHSFSHQKFQTKNAGGDTCVFYPGWCPQVDWKKKIHYGGTTVTWFDRWSLEAVLLPAFEHCAAFGMPMHFGEFGVIGFANAKSSRSTLCWTRDTVETFEKIGADWHIWNEGFGLRNPLVREYIEKIWKETRDLRPQDFGARADGVAKDTVAIQSAIDAACARAGETHCQVRVTLTPGTYLSGALRLRSGVELHLQKGARLLASPDIADFPDWKDAKHVVAANCPRGRSASFLFADECKNVSITGEGVIDGNGETHVRRKTDPNWTGWEYERIRPMGESLPRVVFLAGCRDVRIEGVSLVNGPAGWGYWIHDCDRVVVRGLTIRSDVRYPNNDGIHVNCSRDVDISDCDIECGDDALVIRANSRSLAENKVCERVHVRDCRVRSWASGVRVGWCCDGTIRDCSFRRITMRDTVNGIDIVLPPKPDNPDYGREATLIEDILFEDIDMDGLYAHPLDAKIEGDPQTTRVNAVRRVTLRRVRANGLELPNVRGRADAPIRDFIFEDCSFKRVSDDDLPGWERHGAANIGRTRPARFENAEGFRLVRTQGWSAGGAR